MMKSESKERSTERKIKLGLLDMFHVCPNRIEHNLSIVFPVSS